MTYAGLAPEWIERLESLNTLNDQVISLPSPALSRTYLTGQLHFVEDSEAAEHFIQACHESPIAGIGIDSEFRRQADHPLYRKGKKEVWDLRSIYPFCMAFAVVSEGSLLQFVIDLRVKEIRSAVQRVLDLPVTFIGHFVRSELLVFWILGLREPEQIWDTYVAERALSLGLFPVRSPGDGADDGAVAIRSQEKAEWRREHRLGLDQVLQRYGLVHAFAGSKAELQRSFLTKPFDACLSPSEIEYCAADARAVAELYPFQRLACDQAGITMTLDRIVMPWTVTATEIEWTGVLYDRNRCQRFLENSQRIRQQIGDRIRQFGIENPGSPNQLANFLQTQNLDRWFPRTSTGRPSTQDRVLKQYQHLHPVIPLIRNWRKVGQLADDPAVHGRLDASDRRVHPTLRVLGADTGRTQSQLPNLMGLGRVFRPLVRAPEGLGIGEVDLAQIEVGIAAAVFRDDHLIEDFNQGDVYVAMAKRIFKDQLSPADLDLDNQTFRSRYAEFRDQTKPLVLGIIYGQTVHGIARDLKTSLACAQELWDSFRRLYPVLCAGMEQGRWQSARRGYAYISGLRRFRTGTRAASNHELRALGNAIVQGTAALVFFEAGNRLRRLLRAWEARIILPVHDAFVFEAPLNRLERVAKLVQTVLIQTVQERFPDLRPRADVNISHPECWNDEGKHDSLERFLEDPLGSL